MEWLWSLGIIEWVKGVFSKNTPSSPTIIVKDGATLNVVQGDQSTHYHFNGPVEIVQPRPKKGKPVPLDIAFSGKGEATFGSPQPVRLSRVKSDEAEDSDDR